MWRIFVKRLLFFALATLLLVPSAFGYDAGERFNFLGPANGPKGGRIWAPRFSRKLQRVRFATTSSGASRR
jgi:hypothetical protein